jgi:hypothetical protein
MSVEAIWQAWVAPSPQETDLAANESKLEYRTQRMLQRIFRADGMRSVEPSVESYSHPRIGW